MKVVFEEKITFVGLKLFILFIYPKLMMMSAI